MMPQGSSHFLNFLIILFSTCHAQQNIYGSKQSYLESITKGSEFSCMKQCVPQERRRYVEDNSEFGRDIRSAVSCEKQNERPVDATLCKIPAGFVGNLTYISGGMYMFPNLAVTDKVKMTWHMAMKSCRGINLAMQLAAITTEKENNGIAKYLTGLKAPAATNAAKDSFWTSGTSLGDEMMWMETGEKIGFTNWVGGKPGTTGKCIQVSLDKGKMVWQYAECSTENRVICEVMDECYKNTCDDL